MNDPATVFQGRLRVNDDFSLTKQRVEITGIKKLIPLLVPLVIPHLIPLLIPQFIQHPAGAAIIPPAGPGKTPCFDPGLAQLDPEKSNRGRRAAARAASGGKGGKMRRIRKIEIQKSSGRKQTVCAARLGNPRPGGEFVPGSALSFLNLTLPRF